MGRSQVSAAAPSARSRPLACSEGPARIRPLSTFSLQLRALPRGEPDPGSLPPASRVTEEIRGAQTDPDTHTNTHTPRARRRADSTRTSHRTRGLVRTKRGQRSREAGEAEATSPGQRRPAGNGRFNEGPRAAAGGVQGRPAEAGSCFSPAGPTRGLRLGGRGAVRLSRPSTEPRGAARNWPFKKTFRARRSRPGPAPRTL
ncbi:uncharacterized protein LOC132352066 isoform X3 [Balaenoptera ricei]|uniref:uncharacterized protein LOC132352066 isoform X3 n=1 Tax=Balaenoptera ricei TaxID=2746895 RepID=UPI0028BE9529|nr:uncharacterized protein LOC132352066 isoform X3 [Balaenoptera ricei]XP_059758583.1 uncharacterized protein LOC132352066 isoform X3 [Balaenoptera ricei]